MLDPESSAGRQPRVGDGGHSDDSARPRARALSVSKLPERRPPSSLARASLRSLHVAWPAPLLCPLPARCSATPPAHRPFGARGASPFTCALTLLNHLLVLLSSHSVELVSSSAGCRPCFEVASTVAFPSRRGLASSAAAMQLFSFSLRRVSPDLNVWILKPDWLMPPLAHKVDMRFRSVSISCLVRLRPGGLFRATPGLTLVLDVEARPGSVPRSVLPPSAALRPNPSAIARPRPESGRVRILRSLIDLCNLSAARSWTPLTSPEQGMLHRGRLTSHLHRSSSSHDSDAQDVGPDS